MLILVSSTQFAVAWYKRHGSKYLRHSSTPDASAEMKKPKPIPGGQAADCLPSPHRIGGGGRCTLRYHARRCATLPSSSSSLTPSSGHRAKLRKKRKRRRGQERRRREAKTRKRRDGEGRRVANVSACMFVWHVACNASESMEKAKGHRPPPGQSAVPGLVCLVAVASPASLSKGVHLRESRIDVHKRVPRWGGGESGYVELLFCYLSVPLSCGRVFADAERQPPPPPPPRVTFSSP